MEPKDPLSGSTADFPLPPDDNINDFISFYADEEPADDTDILDFSEADLFVDDYSSGLVDYEDTLTDTAGDASAAASGGAGPTVYSTHQLSDTWYNKYEVASRYITDDGRRQQAVCGPAGTPPEILRVHGGRTKRIIAWIAERLGTWPVLPHPNTGIAGEVPIFKDIHYEVPCPQADGSTLAYRAKGVYIYACNYVLNQDVDTMSVGTNDVITVPATQNIVLPGTFSTTLLQSIAPGGPFGSVAT